MRAFDRRDPMSVAAPITSALVMSPPSWPAFAFRPRDASERSVSRPPLQARGVTNRIEPSDGQHRCAVESHSLPYRGHPWEGTGCPPCWWPPRVLPLLLLPLPLAGPTREVHPTLRRADVLRLPRGPTRFSRRHTASFLRLRPRSAVSL